MRPKIKANGALVKASEEVSILERPAQPALGINILSLPHLPIKKPESPSTTQNNVLQEVMGS